MASSAHRVFVLGLLFFFNGCSSAQQPAETQFSPSDSSSPPVAKIVPKEVTIGGQKVVDDYWWLRNKSDPTVIEYLKAENAYTDAAMEPTKKLQEKLYNEMSDRLPEVNETVPYKVGDWWYSSHHDKQYPVYVRRRGAPDAKPQEIEDVNKLAEGHTFFDYAQGPVSDDGNLIAFATDVTGNRQYQLQFKDLRTGAVLDDKIALADSFAWSTDNKTVYYVAEDDAKRDYRLFRHELGTDPAKDTLIYEEKDAQFSITVARTRDRKFIICSSESSTTSETRIMPADRIADPILIEPRKPDREYYVDHRDGRFYIRVNDTSDHFRIVSAPDDAPGKENWTEVVPARADTIIDDHNVFAHHLVISERRGGITQIELTRLPDALGNEAPKLDLHLLKFDEPDFTVALGDNFEFDPPYIRLTYTSLTTPERTIDVDLKDESQKLKKQDFVGGGFKASNYHEERLFATAADGTRIPISLVYRIAPATQPAGPRPMLLDAYGAYGNAEDVYFSSSRLSLLDRGVAFAVAHVRGGGEYGREWYNGGRMKNKPNTFGDFLAAAEFLEKNGYTSADKLGIEGASAGGLLIGAVVNRRPDLFHAAIALVPWVDVLADMSDPAVPLTTLEYSEWGNPNVPAERAMIASYDPCLNVKPRAYPAMLVRESLNDSQVQYWDAVRWVARLRKAKKQAGAAGRSELLLKMDMDAGHDGASGQEAQLKEDAFDDAWLLTRLGVEKTN